MSPSLFNAVRELKQFVVRNIVNVLPSHTAFADLMETKTDAYLCDKMLDRVGREADWQFHFTTAIEYPFGTDHFMASRYSDGTFPIWYGSMDIKTTIHETVHHFIKDVTSIASFEKNPVIARKRKVYDVFCQGLLIDLSDSKEEQFYLDDYKFTQSIGKQLYGQGYAGLLAPSARYRKGVNVNIFKQQLLSRPKLNCDLTYFLYPEDRKVVIKDREEGEIEMIQWS